MVRRKQIHALVERLLSEHAVVSAPVPVEKIANSLGVEIRLESADDDLSGFLYRDRQRNLSLIGVNADHHPHRQKFTTAHELAHFLLHDFDSVHVDRQFKVWLRGDKASKGTDVEEKEANLFAAEILMPSRFLDRDVRRIGTIDLLDEDAIQNLAERYGVSPQAMTFRLAYLGYVQQ